MFLCLNPRDEDDRPPLPLRREEALQLVAISLTMLRVQIRPGKRLPGIAKRLIDYLQLCGLGTCKMRWSRPSRWMFERSDRL